ncbi:regulating synaptic membrane exocytosis protein 2-like protein [Pitangus sulphuratus]|nr:regulating synaptic membrane exocytosis protein 2-like protein [Pitangus sulphuratus]
MNSHEPEASSFPDVQWLIKRKRSPSISREQNRRYDQRDEQDEYSQYATSDSAMPRSPSDYSDRRAQRGPQLYEEPELGDYRDSNRRSRRRSKEYSVEEEDAQNREEYERQRREEEYQARYRSDPNLARYPVKPQPYEEQMRIHAEVSRARHERRHSDVSLANTELEDSRMSMLRMERPSRQRSVSERRAAMENQRSYSMERTREAQGPSPNRQRTTNHSPPTPRRSPIPLERPDMRRSDSLRKQHHLDPNSAVRKTKREKMETMLRNDSLSSDQSESIRPPPPKPHKTKKGGKMRQVSLSSSEEELASTPEYTSCDDVEIESESVSEKESIFLRLKVPGFQTYVLCLKPITVILYKSQGWSVVEIFTDIMQYNYDGGDSMKSIQKLGSFGTDYVKVKKMTEKETECGEGRKCNNDCDYIPEGCFRFIQPTTSQGSALTRIDNQQEELCHE